MTKYYRIILINTKTGERQMTWNTWRSKKKALEWATAFCLAVPNSDFELLTK